MPKVKHRRMKPNGRNDVERYVRLEHYMLKSDAWMTMSAPAKALLIQLWVRFNGQNNSEISFSVREADAIGLSKSVAGRAFDELQERGFLKVGRQSSFTLKSRQARTWTLTTLPVGSTPATKDFMRWGRTRNGIETKQQSRQRDKQSRQRDDVAETVRKEPASVPTAGPSMPVCPQLQSRQRDTSNLPCEGQAKRPSTSPSPEAVSGELIRQERTKRGWSLRELARRAKVSHTIIGLIENGTRPLSVSIAAKLSASLDLQIGAHQ